MNIHIKIIMVVNFPNNLLNNIYFVNRYQQKKRVLKWITNYLISMLILNLLPVECVNKKTNSI